MLGNLVFFGNVFWRLHSIRGTKTSAGSWRLDRNQSSVAFYVCHYPDWLHMSYWQPQSWEGHLRPRSCGLGSGQKSFGPIAPSSCLDCDRSRSMPASWSRSAALGHHAAIAPPSTGWGSIKTLHISATFLSWKGSGWFWAVLKFDWNCTLAFLWKLLLQWSWPRAAERPSRRCTIAAGLSLKIREKIFNCILNSWSYNGILNT